MKRSSASLSSRQPYGEWLKENQITLDTLPEPVARHGTDHETIRCRQRAFGYTDEDLRISDDADGRQRRGGDRFHGNRHAARVSFGQAAIAVQLLQAAVCAGDQSADRSRFAKNW